GGAARAGHGPVRRSGTGADRPQHEVGWGRGRSGARPGSRDAGSGQTPLTGSAGRAVGRAVRRDPTRVGGGVRAPLYARILHGARFESRELRRGAPIGEESWGGALSVVPPGGGAAGVPARVRTELSDAAADEGVRRAAGAETGRGRGDWRGTGRAATGRAGTGGAGGRSEERRVGKGGGG